MLIHVQKNNKKHLHDNNKTCLRRKRTCMSFLHYYITFKHTSKDNLYIETVMYFVSFNPFCFRRSLLTSCKASIYINYCLFVNLATRIISQIKLVHLTGIKSEENIAIFPFLWQSYEIKGIPSWECLWNSFPWWYLVK